MYFLIKVGGYFIPPPQNHTVDLHSKVEIEFSIKAQSLPQLSNYDLP